MIWYVILGVGIILAVLLASIFTIHKGYAYKQTVDPLPQESTNEGVVEEKREANN